MNKAETGIHTPAELDLREVRATPQGHDDATVQPVQQAALHVQQIRVLAACAPLLA